MPFWKNLEVLQGSDATELLPSQAGQQIITANVPPALGFGAMCATAIRDR